MSKRINQNKTANSVKQLKKSINTLEKDRKTIDQVIRRINHQHYHKGQSKKQIKASQIKYLDELIKEKYQLLKEIKLHHKINIYI